jgi:glycosyltransferase involved in cell wall biosynthesis
MSAYGTAERIGMAVDSVLTQALPAGWQLELIIAIDKCDETLETVLQIEDERLVVLELAENGGTYRALNTALPYARGVYIAILDSDDIAIPGRFKAQIEAMQRNPEIALLGGQLQSIDHQGVPLPTTWRLSPDALMAFRQGGGYRSYLVPHVTWMVRRETYAQLGGYFDSRVGSDAEFCLRAVALGLHCRSLPNLMTYYRQRDGQLTTAPETNFQSGMRLRMIDKLNHDAEVYRRGERPQPIEPIGTPVRAAYRQGRIPVLAVMPTVPERRHAAVLVVQSLLQQAIDRIVVFLNGHPSGYQISNDPRVVHIYNPPGSGPIVRYREGALGHGVVLSVDDDLIYPPDYVEVARHHLATFGRGAAISYHAKLLNGQDKSYTALSLLHYSAASTDFVECDYLGSGTAIFWGEDFESLRGKPPDLLQYEDDIWMSAQLHARRIRLVRPPTSKHWLRSQPAASDATSLYNLALNDRFAARQQAIAFAEAAFGWQRGPGRPFRPAQPKGSCLAPKLTAPHDRQPVSPAKMMSRSASQEPMDMKTFWRRRFETVRGISAVANLSVSVEQNQRDYARCQAFMSAQLQADFGGAAPVSLLDMGYGQGHYARVASKIGVPRYVGLDFAAPSLSMPGDYHFLEQDICQEGLDLGEKFSVVLLLDVAFHVVERLAFERLLANIAQHAEGVVYLTGLFRDQHIAAHVLHRRLGHFHCLGNVTAIYPWRDILLARIDTR